MLLRWWAPFADKVAVRCAGVTIDAEPEDEHPGWFRAEHDLLAHGVDYELLLDGDRYPDPLARWLPAGVHGEARVYDATRYAWTDTGWEGRALDDDAVIYELHVGTFTAGGTLDSAAERLPHLLELGISHVELMPLAAFDGIQGWGYDGVALNAVHAPYGGPEALCRFVDRAHELGLAVLLDVVHNHLGPSGNYWEHFGPFFNDRHHNPWGAAVNLDAPGSEDVRHLLAGSATGWLRDFHLDGLRLDAVHELRDSRAKHYLQELSVQVTELSGRVGRPLVLIAESDGNDPRTVTSTALGGLGMSAQWDDDIHHGLHWLLTGESDGYYADFSSLDAVSYALAHGFLHDGRYSTFRGRRHGRRVNFRRTSPTRFVASLQTHDQVGNRAAGERLSALVGADRLAAGAALLLTLPYVPMLFMGEEWGASTPWRYFTSFADLELAAAVTAGRRAEFAGHGWDGAIPDPQDPATFASSILDWDERDTGSHRDLQRWYESLIAWRRTVPASGAPYCSSGTGPDGRPSWFAVAVGRRTAVANLGDAVVRLPVGPAQGALASEADAPSADLSWPTGGATVVDGHLVLPVGSTAVGSGLLHV